jgi:hypothetical protein
MNNNEAAAAVFLFAGMTIVLWKIIDTWAKTRLGRKNNQADTQLAETLQSLEQRFARVEVALDDLTGELHRVSESNGFLTRLLSERSREPGALDHR